MGLEPLPVCGWPTFPSVLWCCWLGLFTCKTVSRITYTVFVETLNPAQSILVPRWTEDSRFSLRHPHPTSWRHVTHWLHFIRYSRCAVYIKLSDDVTKSTAGAVQKFQVACRVAILRAMTSTTSATDDSSTENEANYGQTLNCLNKECPKCPENHPRRNKECCDKGRCDNGKCNCTTGWLM